MNTSLILALGVILALNELREWRHSKKHAQVTALLKGVRRKEDWIAKNLITLTRQTAELEKRVGAEVQAHDEARQFINLAQTDLATIVKEYQINGIPLGYQRKNLDSGDYFIEGV